MSRRLQSLLVPVVFALAAGCVPTIRVNVLQPAPVNMGAAKQLSTGLIAQALQGACAADPELARGLVSPVRTALTRQRYTH